MWSIYDTLVLVSGIIVLVIALLPIAGIPAATRLWSGAIGGGLVLLALFLGSLRSFRYPSVVVGGPVIALLVLGAVIADARKRTNPDQAGLPAEQQASGPQPLLADLPPIPARTGVGLSGAAAIPSSPDSDDIVAEPALAVAQEPAAAPPAAASQVVDEQLALADADRAAAWREVHNATTSAERLAGIAGRYPEFGPRMLNHPNAYPELREWIRQLPGEGQEGGRTDAGSTRDD